MTTELEAVSRIDAILAEFPEERRLAIARYAVARAEWWQERPEGVDTVCRVILSPETMELVASGIPEATK